MHSSIAGTAKNYSLNRGFSLIWKSILLFMIVYNTIPIGNIPMITTERIAVVVLCILLFFKGKICICKNGFTKKINLRLIVFQLFLLLYSSLILFLGGSYRGETITANIIFFLLLAVLAYIAWINFIESTEELMQILLLVTVVQCVIIVLGMLNSDFANFLDTVINKEAFFDYVKMRRAGYPGGWGCITSTGSMQLSIGLIASVYFITQRKKVMGYFGLYAFISVISIAVARTSLVLVAISLVLIIYCSIGEKSLKAIRIIGSSILFAILAIVVFNVTGLVNKLPKIFSRVIRLFTLGFEDGFFGNYLTGETTVIPPLSWDTMIGTGIVSGTSGTGITVNADGGFVRMYVAVGLPLAILFYLFIYGTMLFVTYKVKDKKLRIISLLFLCFMIVGELKEFYFYTRYMIVVFGVFASIILSQDREEKKCVH